MYNGVQNTGAPVGVLPAASSTAPKQWWDQNPARSEAVGMNIGMGVDQRQEQQAGGTEALPSSNPVLINTEARGYYRPGMRSPSPTIQKRLEGMASSNPSGGVYGRNYPSHAVDPINNDAAPSEVVSRPSSGLIRLSLRKPMGIVFEPMNDPHNPSQQRGVLIVELPRTGAAALSHKLEIGDELLSINQKTMSRLTFDEIMDFIIEADPDNVSLLFRRPKKEQLNGGPNNLVAGVSASTVPNNTNSSSAGRGVKWVDGKSGTKEVGALSESNIDKGEKVEEKHSEPSWGVDNASNSKPTWGVDEASVLTGDDDTLGTQDTYDKQEARRKRWSSQLKKRTSDNKRKTIYSSESFLDKLIDAICVPIVGDDNGDDYDSDDDLTYNSQDDYTVDTYDSASYVEPKSKKKGRESRNENINDKKNNYKSKSEYEKDNENTTDNKITPKSNENYNNDGLKAEENYSEHVPDSQTKEQDDELEERNQEGAYLDDQTLETVGTLAREKLRRGKKVVIATPEEDLKNYSGTSEALNNYNGISEMEQDVRQPKDHFEPQFTNPINENEEVFTYEQDPNMPMSVLEINDHADVSVMESTGGPSLLIENMRMDSQRATQNGVSQEMMLTYGKYYPAELGLTQEETIQLNQNKFYCYVVKEILKENEPEKVRLLDKLLAKYKGREEHLIQKLSVRYSKINEDEEGIEPKKEIEQNEHIELKEEIDNNLNFSNKKKSGIREESTDPVAFNDDGFQNFPNFPTVSKNKESKQLFSTDSWPALSPNKIRTNFKDNKQRTNPEVSDDASQETDSSCTTDSEYGSIDGTSPAVIAQVSELLNYVYGKTTVPGQIDRVSTIMRAYDGREAVLLELLETKALIKANADNDGVNNLPERLKNNPALMISPENNNNNQGYDEPDARLKSPVSNIVATTFNNKLNASNNDDLSSMSGTAEFAKNSSSITQFTHNQDKKVIGTPPHQNNRLKAKNSNKNKGNVPSQSKKKKGIFGNIFKKKNQKKNKDVGAFPSRSK